MTEEEKRVLKLLGQAYNEFRQLEVIHHADVSEFVLAIHAAQNIILARAGLRATGVYRPSPPVSEDKRDDRD